MASPLEPQPSGPRKGSGKLEPFLPFFLELIAQERDKLEVRNARHDWERRQKTMRAQPHRLIFLDETGTNTKMIREYGRSLRGERLKGSAPFRR